MLSASRYLLGVAEILLVAGLAYVAAASFRERLAPELDGATRVLAGMVLALAVVIVVAEAVGSFGLFEPVPYLLALALVAFAARVRWPAPLPRLGSSRLGIDGATAVVGFLVFFTLLDVAESLKLRLETGMTGFDSTWYHAPFAAGFFQTGSTWDLHYIAPQFLAWFYPANGEIPGAIGMIAFGRDLASPFLNVAWLLGCVLAAWCVGRPYRTGPVAAVFATLVLGASVMSDQFGEARNDIVGIFFLLAAVAVAVGAAVGADKSERRISAGALAIAGLAAGLAAGTKLNFLLPAAILVLGLAWIAGPGGRARALATTLGAALIGGGSGYLRNLIHSGSPLPWFDSLGPISLPSPAQELGGREGHSVLGYLTDGSIWSEWFLPGFHHGFGRLWPFFGMILLAGLVLNLGRRSTPVLRVAALAALAAVVSWLVAPTSASGPDGAPNGFESGLRYIVPALVLGAALVATAPWVRRRSDPSNYLTRRWEPSIPPALVGLFAALVLVVAVGAGYVVQRHYLRDRYAEPSFTTPGLDAAFKWATPISGARIATTSTRQYPLFGTDLSNRVDFVGEGRPHGGFVAPTTCEAWRRLLDEGDYDYVVASRDRIEPGKPPYPPTARWTESADARIIVKKPPTVVFKLTGPLDPSACPASP
jgi:hypothetical protein